MTDPGSAATYISICLATLEKDDGPNWTLG